MEFLEASQQKHSQPPTCQRLDHILDCPKEVLVHDTIDWPLAVSMIYPHQHGKFGIIQNLLSLTIPRCLSKDLQV